MYKIPMLQAATAARHFLGATYPNPPVGAAAIDAKGNVLAVAAHQRAGTPHAEAALLALCHAQNITDKIHTLCVTLEPCNHHGRTPPCTEAIIAAGIKHVVIGASDPNPHVAGGGIQRLQQAGIHVTVGVEEEICRQLIYAFAYSTSHNRPWITIKRAFNETGAMLPPIGEKTFTSPQSLLFAHQLRKRADAILTGSGTILADNPMFTVRHIADHHNRPPRILAILDRRRRVPKSYRTIAENNGLKPIVYDSLDAAVADLARREIREVLIEAGPQLSQSVMDSGLWVMDVSIHKDTTDRIETHFNPNTTLPFDKKVWQWNSMLPTLNQQQPS